jgi:LPXTG-site transpeptidase (sortase) family protein
MHRLNNWTISSATDHWARLIGCALALFCLNLQASESGENDTSTQSQAAVTVPMWIQDPWTGKNALTIVREPDTSLWNAKRIDDYEVAQQANLAPPLGILTISKLNLQVPIWNGTEELILDRGAGRIKGMARMDGDGNLGISGHRDGFFRVLKDIGIDDKILIQSAEGVKSYRVSSIDIVDKHDTSPLDQSEDPLLTIVTCYPFYFVGNAPKRYIVKAKPVTVTLD